MKDRLKSSRSKGVSIEWSRFLPILVLVLVGVLLLGYAIKFGIKFVASLDTATRQQTAEKSPVADEEKPATASNSTNNTENAPRSAERRPTVPRTKPSPSPPVTLKAQPRQTPLQKSTGAVRLAISRDGQTLATLQSDGNIRLWDMATGEQQLALRRDAAEKPWNERRQPNRSSKTDGRMQLPGIKRLAFSPDGDFIALKLDYVIEVWATSNGTRMQVKALEAKSFNTDYVGFSSDGRSVVTAFNEQIAMIDPLTGQTRSHNYGQHVLSMACSPIENSAVLCQAMTSDRFTETEADDIQAGLDLMDLATGQVRRGVFRQSKEVPESPGIMAFAPDGSALAVSTLGGPVVLLDTGSYKWRIHSILRHPYDDAFYVYAKMAFALPSSWAESYLAGIPVYRSSNAGPSWDLWSVEVAELRPLQTDIGRQAQDVVFTPAGRLVVLDRAGRVRSFDPATGQELR